MDLVIPFGGHERAIADLKEAVFKGREVKTLQLQVTDGRIETIVGRM